MMRLTNLVLVLLAVGLLATGAYIIGSRVKGDADDRLTPTLSADEVSTAADAQLRPALFAANAYFVDNSTYVGMTDDELRSKYDAGLAPGLEVEDATPSGFCVEVELDGRTFSYRDRRGAVAPGNGC
jgi:hypothetical protein